MLDRVIWCRLRPTTALMLVRGRPWSRGRRATASSSGSLDTRDVRAAREIVRRRLRGVVAVVVVAVRVSPSRSEVYSETSKRAAIDVAVGLGGRLVPAAEVDGGILGLDVGAHADRAPVLGDATERGQTKRVARAGAHAQAHGIAVLGAHAQVRIDDPAGLVEEGGGGLRDRTRAQALRWPTTPTAATMEAAGSGRRPGRARR